SQRPRRSPLGPSDRFLRNERKGRGKPVTGCGFGMSQIAEMTSRMVRQVGRRTMVDGVKTRRIGHGDGIDANTTNSSELSCSGQVTSLKIQVCCAQACACSNTCSLPNMERVQGSL